MKLKLGSIVRGENMFGREKEIQDLWKQLASDHALLLAPRRVGKTSIMMHLHDHPGPNHDVIYLDVEAYYRPEQFVGALAEELAKKDRFKGLLENIPGLASLKSLLQRLKSIQVTPAVKLELNAETAADWRTVGRDLLRRIKALIHREQRSLVVIIDEFPYLIRRMAGHPELGAAAVEDFLTWFRSLRQDADLLDHVRYLLGGSIGLEGVLAKLGLTAVVNDIYSFPLGAFSRQTARNFLLELEAGESFDLKADEREHFLDALNYLLPFHIQLLFAAMKNLAGPGTPTGDRVEAAIESLLGPQGKEFKPMAERLKEVFATEEERLLADIILRHACQTAQGISRGMVQQLLDAELATSVNVPARAREDLLLSVLDTLQHDGYLAQIVSAEGRPGRYVFQSELLRRWWKRRYAVDQEGHGTDE